MNKTRQPQTADRKNTHLDLAKASQSITEHPLNAVSLPYCALPECDLNRVSLTTEFLGTELAAPLMITGMTGGTDRAMAINRVLADTAQKKKLALGFGSQRASLESGQSQAELRHLAPDAVLVGNLGGAQLAGKNGMELARAAVEDIKADALAIHLNPLQEAIQPEGDHDWRGVLASIEVAVDTLNCPVLVKEVGAGLSGDVVQRLAAIGVRHVDVAARGGTNWAEIELDRRPAADRDHYNPFLTCGLILPDAIAQARAVSDSLCVIASGGVRHGLDAAKCLWLGADLVGMAGQILRAAEDEAGNLHPEQLCDMLDGVQQQLRLSMFLAGKSSIKAFKGAKKTPDRTQF
jgi:isopentenyl-diphosphate delta-isomerase